MHNSLTHRSYSPSNPREEFLLKILKLRYLFAFYTSSKFTLFTQKHYFTENRKKEKKIPLTRWKSYLIYSHMKNKSDKLPFITKNSTRLVRTICSQMKNKSVKLQFVTKNSKHFVGTICSHMKKSIKLPFVTKNSKHLVGTSGDDVSALIEFTPLSKTKVSNYPL